MLRIVAIVFAALSGLLCAAVLGYMIRSHWCYDFLAHEGPYGSDGVELISVNGYIIVYSFGNNDWSNRSQEWSYNSGSMQSSLGTSLHREFDYSNAPAVMQRFGFMNSVMKHGNSSLRIVLAPAWFIALMLSILPGVVVTKQLRRRALKRVGLCSQCGYDLRESPDRCPECGKQVSAMNRVKSLQ